MVVFCLSLLNPSFQSSIHLETLVATRVKYYLQAQQYASLRKPYLVNDMLMQDILLDRRKVYQQLQVSLSDVSLQSTHA